MAGGRAKEIWRLFATSWMAVAAAATVLSIVLGELATRLKREAPALG